MDSNYQVVWILLEFDGIPFIFINIYALNKIPIRSNLCEWYVLSLPPFIWLMYGDFIMAKKSFDKKSFTLNKWSLEQHESWLFKKQCYLIYSLCQ